MTQILSDKTKKKTSKGETVFAVAAISSLLIMTATFNLNTTFLNAKAFDIDNPDNKQDIGKSVECVKVVLGCGGQGTVGDNKPIGPIDPSVCEECFADLSDAQREALLADLSVYNNAELCMYIENLTADILLELLLNIDVDLFLALDILDCLGVT